MQTILHHRWPARLLGLALVLNLFTGWSAAAHAAPSVGPGFDFSQVVALAADLAEKPFQEPQRIPEFLTRITFDQWRDIRFNPKKALWAGEKRLYEVQFFHPGFLYDRTVKINVVNRDAVLPLPFSPDFFDYGMNDFKGRMPKDLGYAGFRLHYPLNTGDYYDEVLVFLGFSYFRALARGQQYGLSGRGLAIDTALDSGEEFPAFKEFWLIKPKPDERTLTLYALLDSPSVSGGYEFKLEPGKDTRLRVKATLFQRRQVKKLGLAPLTSMYFYGENVNLRPIDDFRPEIHDSDGLLMANGSGEWIWRPLRNPKRLAVSAFQIGQLKGFGLLQRDLDFDHYQDLESLYHKRPSVWITPEGDWGPGQLELIEIPSDHEINDNAVAFWVPRQLPALDQPLKLAYRMSWHSAAQAQQPLAQVVATRRDFFKERQQYRLIIEFSGGELSRTKSVLPLNPQIKVGKGAHLVEQQLQKNPFNGTWRLAFMVRLEDKGALDKVLPQEIAPIELEALLKHGEKVVSEKWSYRLEDQN